MFRRAYRGVIRGVKYFFGEIQDLFRVPTTEDVAMPVLPPIIRIVEWRHGITGTEQEIDELIACTGINRFPGDVRIVSESRDWGVS